MRALALLVCAAALPPWAYADDSGCLQSYTNYAALWATMKGTGIDTGRPSSKIQAGTTCAKLGYTDRADTLKDLPLVFKALYAGVTAWQKPQSALAASSGRRLSYYTDRSCSTDANGAHGAVFTQVSGHCFDVLLECGAGSRVPGECTGDMTVHIELLCGSGDQAYIEGAHYGSAGCEGTPQYTVPAFGLADAAQTQQLLAGACVQLSADTYGRFDQAWSPAELDAMPTCPTSQLV